MIAFVFITHLPLLVRLYYQLMTFRGHMKYLLPRRCMIPNEMRPSYKIGSNHTRSDVDFEPQHPQTACN